MGNTVETSRAECILSYLKDLHMLKKSCPCGGTLEFVLSETNQKQMFNIGLARYIPRDPTQIHTLVVSCPVCGAKSISNYAYNIEAMKACYDVTRSLAEAQLVLEGKK